MDKKVINQIIELIGDQAAIKAVCNITDKGPIDEKTHANKIERARWFGLLEDDSLTLTDLGKMFAAKLLLDFADNVADGGVDEDDDDFENDDLEDEDFDEFDDEDWEDIEEDEDWDDENLDDEDFDDEDLDEEDDDFRPEKRKRGKR